MPEILNYDASTRPQKRAVNPEKLKSFTLKWMGHFEREFEQHILPRVRENYQLMQNYDEILIGRKWRSRRVNRQAVSIPKVYPEVIARMAHELSTILSANPPIRCLPPKNASPDQVKRAAEIEEGINDLMDSDDWILKWYDLKWWASVAPYVAMEIYHEEDVEYVPTEDPENVSRPVFDARGLPQLDQFGAVVQNESERLRFEEQIVRTGAKTRVLHPWECFFDYTAASLNEVPILFIRDLMASDEIQERFDLGEWLQPETDWKVGRKNIRNYGLEIIRSVPTRGTTGSYEQNEWDKDRHEILYGFARVYDEEKRKMSIQKWTLLNRTDVVSGPTEQINKRVKIPYIIYAAKPIPGTQMGIAPAESVKQIQRANNQLFNLGLESGYYNLEKPTYIGAGVDFAEENPTFAPSSHIPVNGDVNQIKQADIGVRPDQIFPFLEYMDKKGQLVSDVNDTALGLQKQGTPPTAFETGQAQQALATKLGMFIIVDMYAWMIKWAEMMYWVTMENNPVNFSIKGKAYNLMNWVVRGGPQFDLPQVAEVSGRASDRVLMQGAYQTLLQNPIIASDPARLAALTEKFGYAMGYTWIDEILNPQTTQLEPPSIRPETLQMVMMREQGGKQLTGGENVQIQK